MDVGAADTLEGVVVGAELNRETGSVEFAKTTSGGRPIEGETEDAGVKVIVPPKAKGSVKVL